VRGRYQPVREDRKALFVSHHAGVCTARGMILAFRARSPLATIQGLCLKYGEGVWKLVSGAPLNPAFGYM